LAPAVALGAWTLRAVDRAIEPELANRAGLVGSVVRANIQRALDLGVPLDRLGGTDAYLNRILSDFSEISFIAIAGADGGIPFLIGVLSDADRATLTSGASLANDAPDTLAMRIYPVSVGGVLAARIAVGVDRAFVARQFQDVFLDLGVVVLVAVLLAFEIMLALVRLTVAAPLEQFEQLLDRQAAGDFSRGPSGRERNGSRGLARLLSSRADALNAHYQRLAKRLASAAPDAAARLRQQALARRFGLGEQWADITPKKNVDDIRLPLFLFATAEELSKPFLPLYTRAAENSFP
jgi:hypothetical protein